MVNDRHGQEGLFFVHCPEMVSGFILLEKNVTFANHVTFTSSLVKDILGIMYHYRQRIKPCSHKTLVKTMVKWLKEGWQNQDATRELSIGRLWWGKWRSSRNSASKLTCLSIPNPMIYQRISCGNNQNYMLKLLLPPLSSSLRFILTLWKLSCQFANTENVKFTIRY